MPPILTQILKGCLALVLLAILGAVAFSVYFGFAFKRSLEPVTNLSKYDEIKSEWPADLLSHFPASAPSAAVFHFQPGFLQGGSSLQLKVETSAEEAREALRRYSELAIASARGGNINTHRKEMKDIPSTFFYTGPDAEFPDDYTIITLLARDHGEPGHSWNHGSTAGVAVSVQRHSIVYWAENW